jgi:hypothetical protein
MNTSALSASAPSPEAPFRSVRGRTGGLTAEPMNQVDAGHVMQRPLPTAPAMTCRLKSSGLRSEQGVR